MSDISLPWNGDVVPDDTGDILCVDGDDETTQRLLRRILTTPAFQDVAGQLTTEPDYVFHADYGGGAREFVGKTATKELRDTITNRIRDQLQNEDSIDSTTTPSVTVKPFTGGLAVDVVAKTRSGGLVLLPQIEITP